MLQGNPNGPTPRGGILTRTTVTTPGMPTLPAGMLPGILGGPLLGGLNLNEIMGQADTENIARAASAAAMQGVNDNRNNGPGTSTTVNFGGNVTGIIQSSGPITTTIGGQTGPNPASIASTGPGRNTVEN